MEREEKIRRLADRLGVTAEEAANALDEAGGDLLDAALRLERAKPAGERVAHTHSTAAPTPEIMPDLALSAGAAVVGTGRSDFPNQINNVLAFPGVFRGALDARARVINEPMKHAAAHALADLVGDRLTPDFILPLPFDPAVRPAVAEAVAKAARDSGAARI